MRSLLNILNLSLKELVSLRHDKVLMFLIFYTFTIAVYIPAKGTGLELRNASIAIVDEDNSHLSQRIRDAFFQPYFQKPVSISIASIDPDMDRGEYTFVIDIPPHFEADAIAGKSPEVQVNVDATAMSQAGIGAGYIRYIINDELEAFLADRIAAQPAGAARIVTSPLYNENLESSWFMGIMQIINMITVLAIVLTGAALIREREHGTIDHLLVMPLSPLEIMSSKVIANGLVIILASMASLYLIIHWAIGAPFAPGAIPFFLLGATFYLFSVTSIGILLATIARSMPQLGLLFIPVVMPMMMLSGGFTPLDSMPEWVQWIMAVLPSPHFVRFSAAVLFKGAGMATVWPSFLAIVVIGTVFFLLALARFRTALTTMGS